jgi:hypothetical protein
MEVHTKRIFTSELKQTTNYFEMKVKELERKIKESKYRVLTDHLLPEY